MNALMRIPAAVCMAAMFLFATPAAAQSEDPLIGELVQSLADAIAAIEPDQAEINALTEKAAVFDAEAADLEAQAAAKREEAKAVRSQIADIINSSEDRRAEAVRLWEQLGTYLMVTPAPQPDPTPDPTPAPEGWLPATALEFAGNATSGPDWSKLCQVSNWAENKLANGKWVYGYVKADGDSLVFTLDGNGSSQIQCLGLDSLSGRFGVVVNFDNLTRGGIVGAPLWLYSGWNEGNADGIRYELDFEFTGTLGLELNYHDGIHPGRLIHEIPGDFSGRDLKLEIEYDAAAGYADFYVDGALVYHLTKAEVESWGMRWIDKPMRSYYDVWATNNPGWTGGAYDPSQTTTMTIKSVLADIVAYDP